jgi:UDP-N-acetylmuramoyl-tripeptide--D-alanyl-D-alanine ligase
MNFSCADAAGWCGAKLRGGDVLLRGVSTDTRTLRPGDLFVAIRGPHHDGHDFVHDAVERGAAAVLVSRSPDRIEVPRLEVDDPVLALGEIAHAVRRRFDGPVVAITGSNGKTTTKELCAEIVAAAGPRVRRSPGNLNNAIGLPLSLLGLDPDDEVLVVELGMNHPGEIDALARIAEPTVGAITQVARAHLEGLGSLDAVARAKGELLDRLPSEGTAVLNAADPLVAKQSERFSGETLWFGLDERCDFRATSVKTGDAGSRFELHSPAGSVSVEIKVPGRHMVDLALCAAACAFATGRLGNAPLVAFRTGLSRFRGVPGRLQLRSTSGVRILDDTYNANPASATVALATLRETAGNGRSVAVLGDMLELGEAASALHAEVGKEAGRLGIDVLIAVGPLSRETAEAAEGAGVDTVHLAADSEEAGRLLCEIVRAEDTVLVKGSRGMRMERALAALEGA